MKKVLFCLTALFMLVACNTKTEQQNENGNPAATTEMQESDAIQESQDGWSKQTTIMSSRPMLVDFYATWCGPCKELAPVLDEIEKDYKGEVIFKRIDVDQEPNLAMEFNIEAIPTLMFITPSGEYQTMIGLQTREDIQAKINELLKRCGK